jgi:hypothetical protein
VTKLIPKGSYPDALFQLGWFAHPIFSSEGDYPAVMKERIFNNSLKEGRTRSRLPSFSKTQVKYIQGWLFVFVKGGDPTILDISSPVF